MESICPPPDEPISVRGESAHNDRGKCERYEEKTFIKPLRSGTPGRQNSSLSVV